MSRGVSKERRFSLEKLEMAKKNLEIINNQVSFHQENLKLKKQDFLFVLL